MKLLINHLTRMAAGYICVAGLNASGDHVRPVLEGRRLNSELLAHNGGPFELGATVELASPRAYGRTPQIEDHLFDAGLTSLVQRPTPGELWSRAEANAELSLVDIFGHDLEKRGKKALVSEGAGRASLGTLVPGYLPRLECIDGRARLSIYDPQLEELHLSVADIRLFRESGNGWELIPERLAQVQAELRSKRTCLLSVGLTRPFAGSTTDRVHWLQVNNIIFRPRKGLGAGEHQRTMERSAISEMSGERRATLVLTESSSSQWGRPSESPSDRSFAAARPVGGRQKQDGVALTAMRDNMWPSRLPSDTPKSERAIWTALGKLPAEWRVMHGVRWQALRGNTQGDGEADFLLIHPDRGILVIEAKGGAIRVENGVWHAVGRHGTNRIDPIEQAQSSKHALIAYFRTAIDDLPWVAMGHAVWFSDVRVKGGLGPAAPAEIILDRTDLANPVSAIERVCRHWRLNKPLSQTSIDAMTRALAPTVDIRITLADQLSDIEDHLIRLTDEQARALNGLRRARRVLIMGGAGTGKTVLAVERARLLSASNARVALVCYNRPLGKHLERMFDGDAKVDAGHFHGLAHRWVELAGLDWPADPDRSWWDDPVAELVLEATDVLSERYDAVIVDEGQDFAPSWFLAMEGMLNDARMGQMVVFADRNQAIYRPKWEPPYNSIRYDLDVNVRNTVPIAQVVARLARDQIPTTGAYGPAVEFVRTENPDLRKTLSRIVHRLVREEGVNANSLVILVQRKEDLDLLAGSQLGGFPIQGLEEEGNGIVAETIHRFKGMESPVAIVVLRQVATGYDRALAYIGTSRAKAQLVIVGPDRVGIELGLA